MQVKIELCFELKDKKMLKLIAFFYLNVFDQYIISKIKIICLI